MNKEKTITPVTLAATTVFTALVCVATMVFSIYVPATSGFFNIGESVIFLTAILFGPIAGGFAGGVGSALADILLGYWYYAPATLIIKACEGAIVGIMKQKPQIALDRLFAILLGIGFFLIFGYELGRFHLGESVFYICLFALTFILLLWLLTKEPRKLTTHLRKHHWRAFTILLGIIIGIILILVGTAYYSGKVELTLGSDIFILYIPTELWVILGTLAAFAMALLGLLADPEFGWTIFSVITGGLVMVFGYFIYQLFLIFPLFNIEVIAIAEIPVNIGQMIIGAIVALPIAKVVLRAFPTLKEKKEQILSDISNR